MDLQNYSREIITGFDYIMIIVITIVPVYMYVCKFRCYLCIYHTNGKMTGIDRECKLTLVMKLSFCKTIKNVMIRQKNAYFIQTKENST